MGNTPYVPIASPMNARVLAIQLSQPSQVQGPSGIAVNNGWRTILAVQYIFAKVQTTVFFGNQLVTPGGYSQSAMDSDYIFHMMLKPYFGKPMTWVQLMNVPLIPTSRTILTNPNAMASALQQPISSGTMTVIDAGHDAQIGMYVEFAGNYFLTSTIFTDWAMTPGVHRDGPLYDGYLSNHTKKHSPMCTINDPQE